MIVKPSYILLTLTAAVAVTCCATQKKLARMKTDLPKAQISVNHDNVADTSARPPVRQEDTLIVRNIDGQEMILMRAEKDEDGQMVASQIIDAACITAKFRNVAERHGKVDICFQITVPAAIQDSKWQLRYSPEMVIMNETVSLDKVIITGLEYQKRQLRGYQQYRKFIGSIITDSTRFVHIRELELFIRRNIPSLYAFRNDSSYVSDDRFNSVFGVSEKEAIDHYTDKLAQKNNDRRIARKDKMYRKYVKSPIIASGIRLDTVMISDNGDYIYDYIQTVATRPGLKKVDVVMSGEVFEQDKRLCRIARSDTLNFYISSLSAFVDGTEKYVTRIIERKVQANSTHNICFASGRFDINARLENNAEELSRIKSRLSALVNNEEFDLDSVTVTATASPEGSWKSNEILSEKRGRSVAAYFDGYIRTCRDSLKREAGVEINLDGSWPDSRTAGPQSVRFICRQMAENWEGLERMIQDDSLFCKNDREDFARIMAVKDPDTREDKMKSLNWYDHVRDNIYPKLRTVEFGFHLHRKGMVKDTVHTTVIDSVYMSGVQAIRDRDYETAVRVLMPYADYNAAVAYCALDRNANAMNILMNCEKTAGVNYLLALLYSREGDDRNAVQHYIRSCSQNQQYIHRGNLDPEIARLIKTYKLNSQINPNQ